MPTSWIRLGLILCCFSFSSCGSKEEAAPVTNQEEPKALEPAIPKAPPPKAQLVGTPTGSGFTRDSIRVQVGPDEGLREQHHPKEGNQFLLVRLGIKGPANLVPKDYRIVIDNNQYTPHAIGFGRPNGVYSSVEYFVGEQVQLVKGNADQVLHDGERIQKCELKNPIVFLVYDVPETLNSSLWHGDQQFSLTPDYEALASDLSGEGGTLTANTPINLGNPNATSGEYSAELLGSTRTRMELVATPTDVMILTIELSTDKASTIELTKEAISLEGEGGSAKGGTIYFHFQGAEATLTSGSSYTEGETYEDRKLIGLMSGSFRLPLSPASPVKMTMIFPEPKLTGDLELRLASTVSVTIPEPVNPLGKFPPPVEKLPSMVAWASLIGTPLEAGYLSGSVSFANDYKQLASPTPKGPASGLNYLMVRFRMDTESRFVPIDYRIAEQESNTVYKPVGVAFGELPVYVKGLDYEKLSLKLGEETKPLVQAGKLAGWTLKTGEVKVLFEVSPAKEFVFIHGDTQFVIEL